MYVILVLMADGGGGLGELQAIGRYAFFVYFVHLVYPHSTASWVIYIVGPIFKINFIS